MSLRHHQLHGLRVSVTAAEPIQQAISRRLAHFAPASTAADADADADIRFVYREGTGNVVRPRGAGRCVLAQPGWNVSYFEDTSLMHFDVPMRAQALCNGVGGVTEVGYSDLSDPNVWLLSHPLFTAPLSDVFKRRARYMVHAACLTVDGRGILIAGSSGAGKSTLTVALARAGFGFLGDDTVWLTRERDGVSVMGFPDEIDITPRSAAFFPELQQRPEKDGPLTRGKFSFDPVAVYGVRPGLHCVPELLLFPSPSPSDTSTFSALSRGEAVIELLCNVVRTDPGASQAHLDALVALVAQCRCLRFHAGRDFANQPGIIASCLPSTPAPVPR